VPTLEQLRRIWERLPGTQRATIVMTTIGLVAIIVLVGSWASRTEYAVLYGNLDPEDAGAVTEELRGQNVPYKLDNGGRTVLVPNDKVYDTRLTLASAGLPNNNNQGYELLDTSKLGWTDFVQKLQFRRALEGEIGRTIQALDAVEQARVHIVMPEPSLFVEETRPATASVMLKVRPGSSLRETEVRGIVHLVASSVEGLQPGQVTVIDTSGRLLSSPQDPNDILGSSSDQLTLARSIEEGLARKAQSALEQVLGPNRAVVRVAAEIDLERAERTREIYDGENPVVRSEQRSQQETADAGTSESATTNYEISKTIERIVDTPGSIRRLTASVFVDGTYQESPTGGERTYVPRSSDEMQKLTSLIKNVIGYNAERGDELTVENLPFDDTEAERTRQALEKTQGFDKLRDIAGTALPALIGLGALALLWRMVSRARAGLAIAQAGALTEGESEPAHALLPRKGEEALRMEKRLRQVSQESPETIARVVRAWLTE
jgi:flagellar M-ring protein FliF